MNDSSHSREESRERDGNYTRIVWLVIAASLIGLAVLVLFVVSEPAAIEDVRIYERQTRGHDNDVVYVRGDLPPVGGVHHNEWLNCGVYEQPVPAEKAVHSLEHGAVWITYRPDLPAEQIRQLQLEVGNNSYLILSPYPDQRSPLVLTAWGVQLELEDATDARLPAFIARYRLGPTTPERGAPCSEGVGDPIAVRP